jgi:hypothetical protein
MLGTLSWERLLHGSCSDAPNGDGSQDRAQMKIAKRRSAPVTAFKTDVPLIHSIQERAKSTRGSRYDGPGDRGSFLLGRLSGE